MTTIGFYTTKPIDTLKDTQLMDLCLQNVIFDLLKKTYINMDPTTMSNSHYLNISNIMKDMNEYYESDYYKMFCKVLYDEMEKRNISSSFMSKRCVIMMMLHNNNVYQCYTALLEKQPIFVRPADEDCLMFHNERYAEF